MNGILIFLCLIVLLLSGLPVAFSLASLSLILLLIKGISLSAVPHMMYGALDSFNLASLPLFILMAMILHKGNVGKILFGGINNFVGHIPGGVAIASIICCAIMAAIAGTSSAVAVTIGIVAIPAMREIGYSRKFVVGLIAAAGTLGQLIPPSVPMIFYATVTGESIGRLFISGILPGILLAILFIIYIYLVASRRKIHEPLKKAPWRERWEGSKNAIWVAFLPPIIIGGIYTGLFTATEAAAAGVVYSLVICLLIYRTLRLKDLFPVFRDAVLTSAMLLFIVSAAMLFGHTVTLMQVPQSLVNFVAAQNMGKWTFLISVMILYLFLGCFLESAAMILIGIPIFLPILQALKIDLIWFNVLLIMNIEIAMVTPPVGINLFVLQGIVKDTSMGEIFMGALPFLIILLFTMGIVILFPPLATWLPALMM